MIQYDFHISKSSRIKYVFDESLYSLNGNVIIANAQAARYLSNRINEVRKSEGASDRFVTAGEINALGLLHEIYHYLLNHYSESENPGVMQRSIEYLTSSLNEERLNKVLLNFVNEFPPLDVYKGDKTSEEYLKSKTNKKANKEIILEELIILYFENNNPAVHRLNELFSDKNLKENSPYTEFIIKTEEFFDKEKPMRIGGLHLFSMFRKPIAANPYNLENQLLFIKNEWGLILDERLLSKLLQGTDLIREDYKLFIKHGGGEKATPPVPDYTSEMERLRALGKGDDTSHLTEAERFTDDSHWMPDVVMIAKNIFVWMHQLSQKYGYQIKRLDEIPDQELNQLAEWNYTALWLIGIWERSSASRKIKQMMGNPEAAASAYSLYDYEIAWELGGEEAFNNFKHRAWLRGIRLASDMVPNHTGIYSRWMIEKPDYFIRTAIPPFHNYKFTGANLSDDDRVEIRIEDKYYTHEDAAVVFERKDNQTGERVYIYHGNDGTNMPWNDTAQLNLLNPEVRSALINIIKHVAQKTPIIRFDAAMTLSNKHYQRLWYPEPGSGGAIPSRSDYSMTKKEFYKHMPVEFWREVVDTINRDMPNTLLLAEAFWLMEGYFVRTLGMHRVYNSAFMHMLMKEENDKYRKLIKNTLEFNPEILKRYVNFMSNPDEETAVNQFGKGDKYFGVAMMMVTLPGLPMFGHGQIEGFSEKYGMEYKKAYYDEVVDEHLVWRHKKEIFPLLKLRHLFSQVENFELYDFIDINGNLNENVFAYSNHSEYSNALVIFNNSYQTYDGAIKYSNPKINNRTIHHGREIASIFNFKPNPIYYYIYTDHRTQLQFLLSGRELNDSGFRIKVFGYQYRICLNFSEVYDIDGKYEMLNTHLSGRGVASIDDALLEMHMIPLHSTLEELLAPPNIRKIRNYIFQSEGNAKVNKKMTDQPISNSIKNGVSALINQMKNYHSGIANNGKFEKSLNDSLESTRGFYKLWNRYNSRKTIPKWMMNTNLYLPLQIANKNNLELCIYITFIITDNMLSNKTDDKNKNFDNLILSKPLVQIFNNQAEEEVSYSSIHLIQSLIRFNSEFNNIKIKFKKNKNVEKEKFNNHISTFDQLPFAELLRDKNVSGFLKVNYFAGITYFSKERFENLVEWLFQLIVIKSFSLFEEELLSAKEKKKNSNKTLTKQQLESLLLNVIKSSFASAQNFIRIAEESGYDLEKFISGLINVKKIPKIRKNEEIYTA